MRILFAALAGFALDLLAGDPAWIPHPVVLMGKYISTFENAVRPRFPRTPQGEFRGGLILAVSLPPLVLAVTGTVRGLAARFHPLAGFAAEVFWGWQSLALRGLAAEGKNIYRALTTDSLSAAQIAVGRIVGRDTESLTADGVIKAAVESVSENFCDGVAAPLLYLFLGGAPLAMAYKAVNTMDSMVGYRNARYLYFGRAAAKLDDAANYIPARIAAWCWIAAAALTGQDAGGAYRIWRRDRNKTDSPNAGQTETACAGALGIQLGGPARYFGQVSEKPFLGDAVRTAEPEDILRSVRMLYAASILLLFLCCAARALILRGCRR